MLRLPKYYKIVDRERKRLPLPLIRDANHGNVGADLRVCPRSNPIMLEIIAAFTVSGG